MEESEKGDGSVHLLLVWLISSKIFVWIHANMDVKVSQNQESKYFYSYLSLGFTSVCIGSEKLITSGGDVSQNCSGCMKQSNKPI